MNGYTAQLGEFQPAIQKPDRANAFGLPEKGAFRGGGMKIARNRQK